MNHHDTVTTSELPPVLSNPVLWHSSNTKIAPPSPSSSISSSTSNEQPSTAGATISVAQAWDEKKRIVCAYEKRIANAERLLARLVQKYKSLLVESALHAVEEKTDKLEIAEQVTKITRLEHDVHKLRCVNLTLLERAENSRKEADEANQNLVNAYGHKAELDQIYAQTVQELNVKTEELGVLKSYLAVGGETNVYGYQLALATDRAEKYRRLNAELAFQKALGDQTIAQLRIDNQHLRNQILPNRGIIYDVSSVGPIRTARPRSIAPSPFVRRRHPLAESTLLADVPK
ncbi:uncharacterized protein CcaverHIS019_0502460 [Cutaneotrichosporon cavernicola]|uniref:Uncharacterized protein n=1 Tax=Cutaneotrichosporon cavernicola TaxID=279322 RepID=A0AA48L628_9TREE|nr:uncharacterized protein CcaverHIS019_0502460 [Cutaneotrichosporon cavernicola]BEI92618.1 hypothetical protein CcaverHIS019_0502460 [Cutaneotrichosporon cavernicola]